jgi:hypothetical protein
LPPAERTPDSVGSSRSGAGAVAIGMESSMSAAGVGSGGIVADIIPGIGLAAAEVRRGVTGRRLVAAPRFAALATVFVVAALLAAGFWETGFGAVVFVGRSDLATGFATGFATVLAACPPIVFTAVALVAAVFLASAAFLAEEAAAPPRLGVLGLGTAGRVVVVVRAVVVPVFRADAAGTFLTAGFVFPAPVVALVGAFLAAAIRVFLLANDCGLVSAWRLRNPAWTQGVGAGAS